MQKNMNQAVSFIAVMALSLSLFPVAAFAGDDTSPSEGAGVSASAQSSASLADSAEPGSESVGAESSGGGIASGQGAAQAGSADGSFGEDGSGESDVELTQAPADGDSREHGDAASDDSILKEEDASGASAFKVAPQLAAEPQTPSTQSVATSSVPAESMSAVLVNSESVFCAAARDGKFNSAAEVKFAVWSVAGGQDDLRWYDVARMPDSSWAMNAPVRNHRSTGLYCVHAYAKVNGSFEFIASTTFAVSTPKASAVRLFQLSEGQGTFTVYADGVSGAPVRSVRVAVWAIAGGQDDLRWYDAAKVGGSYTFGAYMLHHKAQTGVYVADAYAKLASGMEIFLGRSTANLKVSGGSLSYRNDGDVSVTVSCRGGLYDMASGVRYAVWSVAGGQDDLRWYGASRMPDRSWPVAIPISNHRTAGAYIVHAYGTYAGGQTLIGITSFTISPNKAAAVSTSLHDNGRGSFLVTVSGVSAPSGVSKVEIPIWTKANQSDIRWYRASRQSNGTYTLCVSATSHNLANYYYIHAYVTSKNGMRTYVGQASGPKLNLVHYAQVEGSSGSGYRSVWIKNPPSTSVYVYAWSSVGGQDDLYKYSAAYMGDNVWKATVDCGNLKHSGTVNLHVYGGSAFYKALTFTASSSDIVPPREQAMNNRVRDLSSCTSWLVAVDTSNCFVTVYSGSRGNWRAARMFDCAPGASSTPSKRVSIRLG